MRIVMFYHSLVSDWNHGNAHFLRGIVSELLARGFDVRVYEPEDGWSLKNLQQDHGQTPLQEFKVAYPHLDSIHYHEASLDLDAALAGVDLVIVHEWNSHDLVKRIGAHHAQQQSYLLLFHDTHHRSVTDPQSIGAYDLTHYDGVLAYGRIIRDLYLANGWARRAWTWHEAADTRLFRPIEGLEPSGDLVWIGNWGDDERTEELYQFLLRPVKSLGLKAQVHGVRYPAYAKEAIKDAGIEYAGWLPNYEVPQIFAQFKVTVHVPRRPYAQALPGIPTIRPFEALACGIPLISAPWSDAEDLFTPGQDYLVAHNGEEMELCLKALLKDSAMAKAIADHGRQTVLKRHTCAHRVDELLEICRESGLYADARATPATQEESLLGESV